MKAKQLLEEIISNYPEVVAIAQDEDEDTFVFFNNIPEIITSCWDNKPSKCLSFDFSKIIEWDSEDWTQRIVTINDLK